MKLALRIAVSVAVLALLASLLPWAEVRQALARMSGRVWLAVLGVYLAGHALNAFKWRMLVNAGRPELGRLEAVRFHYAGLFANMWLPGMVGGDVLRAVMASRATARPEAVVLGAVADRLIDTCSLALLLATGGFLVRGILPTGAARAITIALIAGAVVGAVALALAVRRPLRRWPRRLRRPVGRGLVALRRLGRRPGTAASAVALSLLIQGGFVLLNAWIGHDLGITAPLGAWLIAWSLAKLVAVLPISLGGLGVRDATLAALLAPFGVTVALGVVASLTWQTVLIVGGLLGGLVWLVLGRLPGASPAGRTVARVSPTHA
jgi:uncharacterized membrane protein YbhN (UPF0104 family)